MPAAYSYSWANSVVQKLADKYPRATEDVCEILQISPKILAKYLANNDPVFAQLRDLIHLAHNWANSPNWPGWTTQMLSTLESYVHRKGWERVQKRLDELYFKQ